MSDVNSIAREIQNDAAALSRSTTTRLYVLSAMSVVVAAYLGWAYSRIKPFTDPVYVADTLVEIGKDQIPALIDDAAHHLAQSSPEIVRQLEDQVLQTMTDVRLQVQHQAEGAMSEAVVAAMEARDAELRKRLSAKPELALAALDSTEGMKAFEAVLLETGRVGGKGEKAKLVADAQVQLTQIRDRIRKLEQNRGLSAAEAAERRFLVAVLGRVPMQEPTPAAKKK